MAGTTRKMMRAVAIDQFGGIEQLKVRSLPVPEVESGEVLIRLASAGVGVWDPFEREGGFAKVYGVKPTFPYVLGSDGAGTVEAVGPGVTRLTVGNRVYAFALMNPKGGCYAEYLVVRAEHVSPIPKKLPTAQAGAMPVDAMTALRGLDDTLQLKPQESVMIFGASGGIGHMALQLAKRMGARVFAVASGDDGVAFVKRLGADAAVNGRQDDVAAAARSFAPAGLDAALFTAGGPAADQAAAAVRTCGRLAYPNGVEPAPNSPAGVAAKSYDGTPDPEAIDKLNRLIEEGPFEVHVAQSFPLERAADAHRTLETHYLGKLALDCR